YEQQKNFNAARDAYEKALAMNPNFVPALNNLAVLDSERLGRLDAAYDLAKKAKALAPNSPNIADTLGWILLEKNEFANALPLLQESAGKLPDNPLIQYHLGMAQYMLGQEGPARTTLQRAASSANDFPGKGDAQHRLSVLAIDAGTANAGVRTELDNYLR